MFAYLETVKGIYLPSLASTVRTAHYSSLFFSQIVEVVMRDTIGCSSGVPHICRVTAVAGLLGEFQDYPWPRRSTSLQCGGCLYAMMLCSLLSAAFLYTPWSHVLFQIMLCHSRCSLVSLTSHFLERINFLCSGMASKQTGTAGNANVQSDIK